MITPLGVGYAMRMLADVTKGPFEPFWVFLAYQIGLVCRRMVSSIYNDGGESWQWDPLFLSACWLLWRTCLTC